MRDRRSHDQTWKEAPCFSHIRASRWNARHIVDPAGRELCVGLENLDGCVIVGLELGSG